MRLIPAHAGKTTSGAQQPRSAAAHPRSRGENWSMTAMTALAPGSSPLTRGKHLVPSFGTASPRLIPAHAGKTVLEELKLSLGAAHPRSRGENSA